MSVDFDSLTKQVNTHPDLLSDTDITNIRKIVDANPSLFELGWDQPGSQRRDSGVYFNIPLDNIPKTFVSSIQSGEEGVVVKQKTSIVIVVKSLRCNCFAFILPHKTYLLLSRQK